MKKMINSVLIPLTASRRFCFRVFTVLLLTSILPIVGCGEDGEDGEIDEIDETVAVTINSIEGSLEFMPADVTISAGDSIQFVNSESHNALEVSEETYNNLGFEPLPNGFEVDYGETGIVTFDTPGKYFYICTPHVSLSMIGTITVN